MEPENRELQSFFWEYRMDPGFPFSALDYHVIDPASGTPPRLHWHSFYELGICTSGEGIFYFEEKAYEYSAGDVFLINNLEKHGAATVMGQDTHFRFFLFLPELLFDGSTGWAAEYLLPFHYDSARFCNKIAAESEEGQKLKRIMEDLWLNANSEKAGKQRLVRAGLQLLLAELCSILNLDDGADTAVGFADYLRLRPALAYIDANYTSKLAQKDAAALCYLSESRFRHLFRSQMHMSFQDYVARLRYLEARRKIASGEGSIEDAIRTSGISNSYSFYKMFRENEGLTPYAWRKELEKAQKKD